MRLIFLLALWLAAALPAAAADLHFCNSTGTGADGAAVSGSDGNAGTALEPKQTASAIYDAITAASPGDNILLCKGGAWDSFNYTGKSVNGTIAQYIANNLVIGSYSSPNFTSAAKPRLNTATSCTAYDDTACIAFYFSSSSGWGSTRWGGYTIRDLHIDGGGGSAITQGVSTVRTVQNVTVENVTISNVAQFGGCSGQSAYAYPRNITWRNNTLSYALGNGITSFGCDNVLIEGGTIDHAAYGPTLYADKDKFHAIYMSGREENNGPAVGNVVRNILITNTGYGTTDVAGADTKCATAVIVGHAEAEDWLFEGIRIQQAPGTALGPCYGLWMTPANYNSTPEYFHRFTMRGNFVGNVGNLGIGVAACQDCLIENNVVVQESDWEFEGIVVRESTVPPIQSNQAVVLRNNSVYQHGGSVAGDSTGISIGGSGTDHVVAGNLVVFGAGTASGKRCFGGLLAASAYAVFDNNACANHQGWTASHATKADFSAARSGHDTNGLDLGSTAAAGLVAMPSSGNGWSMQITTDSPAKNAGHATQSAPRSISGYPSIGQRDIGAYEFGSNP